MGNGIYDIALGAITHGVNQPTLLALNLVVGLLWLTLAYLVISSALDPRASWLAPHYGFMLALTTVLGGLLNWFIANTGLTSIEEQEAELEGTTDCQRADRGAEGSAEEPSAEEREIREKLKALPAQSTLNIGLGDAAGFDTSDLAVQNIKGSVLFGTPQGVAGHDKKHS